MAWIFVFPLMLAFVLLCLVFLFRLFSAMGTSFQSGIVKEQYSNNSDSGIDYSKKLYRLVFAVVIIIAVGWVAGKIGGCIDRQRDAKQWLKEKEWEDHGRELEQRIRESR